MTNSANGIQRETKVKGKKLGTVIRFKYLGAIILDEDSIPEVLSRIAQATAALRCYRRLLNSLNKDHVTNKDV